MEGLFFCQKRNASGQRDLWITSGRSLFHGRVHVGEELDISMEYRFIGEGGNNQYYKRNHSVRDGPELLLFSRS